MTYQYGQQAKRYPGRMATAALVLAHAVCGGCQSSAPDARPGEDALPVGIQWKAEEQAEYALEMASRVGVEGAGTMVDFQLAAVLRLTPIDVQAHEVTLYATIVEAEFTTADSAAKKEFSSLGPALAKPVFFALRDGVAVNVRVAEGTPAFASAIAQTAIAHLQFGGDAANGGWTAEERDATGTYSVQYKRGASPGHFSKQKLAYTPVPIAGSPTMKVATELRAEVAASDGSIAIESGRLKDVAYVEHLRIPLAGSAPLHSRTELSLHFTGSQKQALPSELASLQASAVAVAGAQVTHRRLPNPSLDEARIGGRSLDELVAAIEGRAGSGRAGGFAKGSVNGAVPSADELALQKEEFRTESRDFVALAAKIRQESEAIEKVINRVQDGSPAARSLLGAIGSAGTPEAQRALAALATDKTNSPQLRLMAGFRLLRFQLPTVHTGETLVALLDDPLLKQHALLGLGAVARNLRQQGRADDADRFSQLLVQRLRKADSDAQKMTVLQGIANSGYLPAFDMVDALLVPATSSSVRGAALQAVRLMQGDSVDAFVAKWTHEDPSHAVHRKGVSVAKFRGYSTALAEALSQTALNDPQQGCRLDAVRVLSGWLATEPTLRKTLERVAESDSSETIRSASMKGLQP